MGAAQREVLPGDEALQEIAEEFTLSAPDTEPRTELKRQVAERLAAHRRRSLQHPAAGDGSAQRPAHRVPARKGRQNAIAAAVAERYAQTPSYRAFLAEQARRAVEEAAAKAEVARRNAEAAAAVQQELLMELELWDAPQGFTAATAEVVVAGGGEDSSAALRNENREGRPDDIQNLQRNDEQAIVVRGLTVRLYEDLGLPVQQQLKTHRQGGQGDPVDAAEAQALDAEIAFRKSPVFEDSGVFLVRDLADDQEPPIPLPANLLEFPRQLVAARRARPRLAEGPLREETPRTQQLRIFEVEAEQISTSPVVEAPAEWATIRLDAHTPTPAVANVEGPHMAVFAGVPRPQTAPMSLRAMAALVDVGLVLLSVVAFVAVVAKMTGELPTGATAWGALGATATVLFLIYQLMFFTLSEQTPGMRYARIGLCTFADDNPTRAAMRRRILAQTLAVTPMGLGLLWSLLDDDGLGWHDRLSRMYQRSY